jgi:hypothetical protein
MCPKSVVGPCGAPVVEVEQPAKSFAAIDWRVAVVSADGDQVIRRHHRDPVQLGRRDDHPVARISVRHGDFRRERRDLQRDR